jgi:hypothetical protein
MNLSETKLGQPHTRNISRVAAYLPAETKETAMKVTIALFVFLTTGCVSAQSSASLKAEMDKLQVSTALVIQSSAIDDSPVWSPDSRYMGTNIAGKWFKVDTTKLTLQDAKWLGQRIGAVKVRPKLEPMSPDEISQWGNQTKHGDSEMKGNSGFRAEIQRSEFSSSLVLHLGLRSTTVWKTDMENCGALSLSPDETYLAYICETNGILVMELPQTLKSLKSQN